MPLKLEKRHKSPNWYIRGTVAGIRIEESTRTSDRKRAEYLKAKRENELLDQHTFGKAKTITFAEAALAYMQAGGEKRFVTPLLDYFGTKPLAEIGQEQADHAAREILPNAKPQTRRRQIYTPLQAIMNHGKRDKAQKVSFTTEKEKPLPVKIPPKKWWPAMQAVATPNLWALLVFMSNTATRVSEALRLTWDDVDLKRGTALLGMTKNGKPRQVHLNAAVVDALKSQKADQDASKRFKNSEKVFNFSDRSNVYRALREKCEKAGIPYFPTHPAGRHTFAARGLEAGWNLKLLQEAGGWSSIKMPAENYGHLEQSQVRDAVMELGKNPGNKNEDDE